MNTLAKLFLAVLSLVATVEPAQDYPPPFPREGAKKVLENESVVIWDVTWEKGKPTPMHQHRLNLVGVTLVPGTVQVTLADGSSRTSGLDRVGEVSSGGKGLTHREEGTSDTPRRAILIELKERTKESSLSPPAGVPLAWPREGASKLLENDQVVVWDYEFQPGREIPLHFHDKDTVVVELEPGVTRSHPKEGAAQETTWEGMRARFAPRGRLHSEEVVSGTPRGILVEIK